MNPEHRKTIGILSGIGPLAGADTLEKLFGSAAKLYGAKEDDEYPDVMLISHGISGVDNTGVLSDHFKNEIIQLVGKLEAAGASIIGIACNTAHIYLPDIKVEPTTTLINLPDIVSEAALKAGDKKHVLLTSSASREAKLYETPLTTKGVSYDVVDDTTQQKLDEIIELIMAYKLERAGKLMQEILEWAKSSGYHSVIAACTELPIAIDNCGYIFGLDLIDSSSELGKAMLVSYYS